MISKFLNGGRHNLASARLCIVTLRGDDLGLNVDELAFYDALANSEVAVREMGDDI
jgi:hypothetical protein